MMRVLIYGLTEPGQPWNVRYVGQTACGRRSDESALRLRLRQHTKDCNLKRRNHRTTWLRRLRDQGQRPGIRLLDVGDEATSDALETFYIQSYRAAGFRLVNAMVADGRKRRCHTAESREKMSVARLGKPGPNAGRVFGPQVRANMSAARRARPPLQRCRRGHPLTPENLRPNGLGCKLCHRERNARYYAARVHPTRGVDNKAKTHCKRGHPFDEWNTYVTPAGHRKCRACKRLRGG